MILGNRHMIGKSSVGMLILLAAGGAVESSPDRPYVAEGSD